MSTIDSLVKFKYKKKFSFRGGKQDDDDEEKKSSESNEEEVEDEEEAKVEKKAILKGSAKLKKKAKKNSDSSYSGSSNSSNDDDSDPELTAKKKKPTTTKKRIVQVKKSSDEEEEEKEEEKNEKQLKKLVKLFPDYTETKIKKALKSAKYNAKKCIDLLIADDNENKSDLDIEEWSDGDESIRERNRKDKEEKRVKTLVSSSSASSSSSSLKSGDNTSGVRKRKFSSDIENIEKNQNPKAVKKARRVLDSDDQDEDDTRSSGKTSSSSGSSSSNSTTGAKLNGLSSHDSSKENHNLSTTDNLDDSNKDRKSHHHHHHSKKSKKDKKEKKDKKKKNKKKKSRNDSDCDGGNDSEFVDSDGESELGSEDDDGFNYKENEKDLIVNCFNKNSLEELQSLVSSKKIENIITMRPFRTFNDLKNKLREKSLLGLISSIKEALDARDMVDALFEKCEEISAKMQMKVELLIQSQESGSKNNNGLEIKYQPKNLNKALSLKPYQLIGLNWLCLMHKEKLNAILADEMGLGKTCQTIAFLAHLLQHSPRMLHLIVVPPSTLDNWVREISTWCPDFYFTVYQGSLDERKTIRYNVLNNKFERPLNGILTTYTMLISTNEDKAFFKKLDLGYVIFDEAHMLKNMNSIRYQGLIKVKSKGKLLLTGTPLQNNLVELMSLLYFVMPDMFHHKIEHIKQVFSFSNRSDADKHFYYKKKIEQAKGIMRPFILRRVKADVLKQLPKKTEEIIYCDMTRTQAKEYEELVSYYKRRKDELLREIEAKREAKQAAAAAAAAKQPPSTKAAELLQEINDIVATTSTLGKKDAKKDEKNEKEDSSNNILMELRKTANHPLLRRVIYDDEKIKKMAKIITKEQSGDTVLEYVIDDLSVMNDFQIHKLCPSYKGLKGFELQNEHILDSGKLIILNSLLEEKRDLGQKVLIFSQFVIALDILEEFMKIKKYKYLRLDGSTPVNERQDMIDCFNHDKEVFVFLLSTKAGGMGINLTAANVVILHDIDFNPYNDKQAEDRCHRVGQTKEVQVYKLLSKDSIDESMLRIQQRKINLGMDISGENENNQATKADMVSLLKEALKI